MTRGKVIWSTNNFVLSVWYHSSLHTSVSTSDLWGHKQYTVVFNINTTVQCVYSHQHNFYLTRMGLRMGETPTCMVATGHIFQTSGNPFIAVYSSLQMPSGASGGWHLPSFVRNPWCVLQPPCVSLLPVFTLTFNCGCLPVNNFCCLHNLW